MIGCLLISACGVSDYINRKKITTAPVYPATPETSECKFNALRMQRVQKYINRVRTSATVCGNKSYPAVAAIQWNHQLFQAAQTHSDDMAQNNFLAHQGTRGLLPRDRVSNAGYDWTRVAENIAGGLETPEQTIDQWLASKEHCENIMNPSHKEFAMACTRNNIADYRIYWTLILASRTHNTERL